jgi:hypothetical protein
MDPALTSGMVVGQRRGYHEVSATIGKVEIERALGARQHARARTAPFRFCRSGDERKNRSGDERKNTGRENGGDSVSS